MNISKRSILMAGAIGAVSLGFLIVSGADRAGVDPWGPITGFTVLFWALAVLFFGGAAAVHFKRLTLFIILGVAIGILPALSFSTLHLFPIPAVEKVGRLILDSVSGWVFRPVNFVAGRLDLLADMLSSFYSSHYSWRYTMLSWLTITTLTGAFWGLTVGLLGMLTLRMRRSL